jgi:hypothetical protein
MTPEEFQKFYPVLLGWIDTTLRAHAGNTQTVVSRGLMPRQHFANDIFDAEKMVARNLS